AGRPPGSGRPSVRPQIEALLTRHPGMGAKDIAAELGLHVATVQKTLATIRRERDGTGGDTPSVVREKVRALLAVSPTMSVSEVAAAVGCHPGTARMHVAAVCREMGIVPPPRASTRERVQALMAARPDLTPAELAAELGLSTEAVYAA